ncbi:hypothetical protein PFICI_02010 [Pestalotiopsis fici W106-1]|uniref:Uncharacterized protein n=1 Tax=Pestalotiopsis fici (strain W106-1 / CGMCC3.15140) TaxID=1229662 RepID=W3XRQ2_PESFW|nr:uncharacterized protein PFICI_02010 [Pestalotiopsis fici W106-1]ETS88182.1 hypothetical protein PFICI_02010 [Pestalotiopsis fici W106-1]
MADREPRPTRVKQDITAKACAVLLKSPRFNWSSTAVSDWFGVDEDGKRIFPPSTINTIYRVAVSRGFDPNSPKLVIKDEFFLEGKRSGRPRKNRIPKSQPAPAQESVEQIEQISEEVEPPQDLIDG